MSAENGIIVAENLVKIYKTKDLEVLALQGLDLVVERGELTAIIGNSGSGKSTLLNMLGGLDKPSAGKLFVDGRDLFKLTEKELADYKRSTVGFVWQNNARNLIPYLTALDNVTLPMQFAGELSDSERKAWALELLDMVMLGDKSRKRLGELSGGEQQRVALAIALANKPKILLADEPTGSVDLATCMQIMSVFRRFNEQLGVTVVIVTHDTTLTKFVKRVVAIRDGKVSSEFRAEGTTNGGVDGDFKGATEAERGSAFGTEESAEADSAAFEQYRHEEYAILDRAGRVQIPEDFLRHLDLPGNRVKLTLDDDDVKLSRPADAKQG
jgi:ABC-type lipoprotein export system ATPase subunit